MTASLVNVFLLLAITFTTFSATARTLVVGVYGDSTVAGAVCSSRNAFGNCVYTQSVRNSPATLQILLKMIYPNDEIIVRNHGIGGSTAAQWLFGGGGVPATFPQMMADPRYADETIVIMNAAINDAYTYENDDDIRFLYNQFAYHAAINNKTFVIETPNPILTGHNYRLGQIAQVMREVGAFHGLWVVDQYAWITEHFFTQAMLPDNIHPSDYLYGAKGWLQFHVLRPVFEARIK